METIKTRLLAVLPPNGASLLKAMFDNTETRIRGISSERFRADHYTHIRSIEQLERHFVAGSYDQTQRKHIYRLNRIALPVIESDRAVALLQRMNKLLPFLIEQYDRNLSHQVLLRDMLRFLGGRDRALSLEAVLYLSGCQGFSGETALFPTGEDAGIFVSERILESTNIETVLEYDLLWVGVKQAVPATLAAAVLAMTESSDSMEVPRTLQMPQLHPRVLEVVGKLLRDNHYWEAVFAASKMLVNFVKEKSGRSELDGAPLMRTVFSAKNPVLALNSLSNLTEKDEQEGMMHLFEGVILGIRNQGAHSFPDGEAQRAVEYLILLSMLTHRVEEAENIEKPF